MDQLRIKLFTPDAILPTRTHASDAGLDLYSPIDVVIPYGMRVRINLHVGIALQSGTVGLIQDRSSLANKGTRILGGVIDANYRGEIQVILAYVAGLENEEGELFDSPFIIGRGDKIAQMLIIPIYTPEIVEVNDFEITDRNDKGFGSSGR